MSDMEDSAEIISERTGGRTFDLGIILGSGLGEAVEPMADQVTIPYSQLPGFPAMQVSGHDGMLVAGEMEGVNVLCLKGRSHYYERGDAKAMMTPIETMSMLGVGKLLITGSVGSVNADLYPGTLALISDHINFNGHNPLIGADGDGGFISMTQAYDEKMFARLKRCAALAGVTLKDGVYMWFAGPSFETPAEVRMARLLGADVIGMSVVPEVILARRIGMRVGAIGAVTNFGAGFNKADPSHIATRDLARQAAITLRRIIKAYVRARDSGVAPSAAPSLRRPT
jgi:purine-nucleoside phosphorylase